jgi:hypothetical protein
MNAPDNPLYKKASVSHRLLKKTIFEKDADLNKEVNEEPFDINKALDSVKDDVKDK